MNFLQNHKWVYFSIFCLFIVAFAPVISYRYFPTVDGPAHLYNAKIIREILFGNSDFYSQYFVLNEEWIPNWSGHFIAVTVGLFLPLWAIEKVLILIIIAGLPLSILMLLRSLKIEISWNFLILLPFTYTLPLYLGFFNFMLAIPLSLVALSWIISWNKRKSKVSWILTSVLITTVYFSHLMVFGILFIISAIYILWTFRIESWNLENGKLLLQKFLSFFPRFILAIGFYSGRSIDGYKGASERLSLENLWKNLGEASSLVGLNAPIETPFTKLFLLGIVFLVVLVLFFRINTRSFRLTSDFILIAAFLFLILYFFIPDGIASGGFIAIRLQLFFLLFLVIWLVAQKMSLSISILTGLLGVIVSLSTLNYRLDVAKELDSDARQMIAISENIGSETVLLPLNYSTNWLHTNLSNYIGANRNVIVLDNYEAVFNVFPIKWRESKRPDDKVGNFAQSLNPEITIENYEKLTGVKIDHLSRWSFVNHEPDSLSSVTDSEINRLYEFGGNVEKIELFNRRK
ncbi:MAG: hypothetical protein IPP71_12805 [Bacteroidetes bacterium]|nr:hypothetical protein [Bacteroidota bacterium]